LSGFTDPPLPDVHESNGGHAEYENTFEFSQYHFRQLVTADVFADPPPPTDGNLINSAFADAPAASNPETEFFASIAGPGTVEIVGTSFVDGVNDGIGGRDIFSRLHSQIISQAGGSAVLGVGPTTLDVLGNWTANINLEAGEADTQSQSFFISVPIPDTTREADRWIKFRENTKIVAKVSESLTSGSRSGQAVALGQISAMFIPAGSPDIAMTSAEPSDTDSRVQFAYEIRHVDVVRSFKFGFFASTDAQLSADDVLLSEKQIVGLGSSNPTLDLAGNSATALGPHILAQDIPFSPDPLRSFIVVVADFEHTIVESDETNNQASFRALQPDVEMISATTTDSHSVTISYRVHEASVANVPVAIIRSADKTPSADDKPLALADPAAVLPGTVGDHTVVVALAEPLGIDPDHDFVLAVADPQQIIPEGKEDNNVAHFRKWVVGAVAHGFEPSNQPPTWVAKMVSALTAAGYDSAIPFDWAIESHTLAPGQAVGAGHLLVQEINAAVALSIEPKFASGDVIDVHLIGHSRGAVVISQAFADLSQGQEPDLTAGFWKSTMLDPHPASNFPTNTPQSFVLGILEVVNPLNLDGVSSVGQLSFFRAPFAFPLAEQAARNLAIGTLIFQRFADDPTPWIVRDVDQSEVFRQHTFARNVGGDYSGILAERLLNLWGREIVGVTSDRDLTHEVPGISHNGVVDWYLEEQLKAGGANGAEASSFVGGDRAPTTDIPQRRRPPAIAFGAPVELPDADLWLAAPAPLVSARPLTPWSPSNAPARVFIGSRLEPPPRLSDHDSTRNRPLVATIDTWFTLLAEHGGTILEGSEGLRVLRNPW
jgi:hypothetical protein